MVLNKSWGIKHENTSYRVPFRLILTGVKQQLRDIEVEMQMLQLEQQDPTRKGNSLFGEVDDRRKDAEKKMAEAERKFMKQAKAYKNLSFYTNSIQVMITRWYCVQHYHNIM